jgi:small subunit ribosomal protein S4
MGRHIGPKNKIARRFGTNLNLKTNSAKVARRLSQPPGVHSAKKFTGSKSAFGRQLTEKQKAKYIYGIRERQFSKYVKEATRMLGDSGYNLQRLLEMRLDNVIYRMGFAITRAQARQMVSHNMFILNGKKMNIPSHIVKPGDVIDVKQSKKSKKIFEFLAERVQKTEMPSWVMVDVTKKEGKILGLPVAADFEKVFEPQLIIEFYATR